MLNNIFTTFIYTSQRVCMCVSDFWIIMTMKASIVEGISPNITFECKALAPQQRVKRGLLICSSLAVGHNKTLGANEAFRHCVTLQVYESSCANKASRTLCREDSAVCDRAETASAVITAPLKSFPGFSCSPL